MKNFKYLTLMATAIVLGFSSCGNDEDQIEEAPKSVTLKVVVGGASTYADETSQSGLYTSIDPTLGGDVYFLSSTTITDHFAITPDASALPTDISVSNLIAGHTFPNVSGSADKVYIVVNKPTGITLPVGGQLSAVEAVAMNITSFTNIKSVTMKGSGDINSTFTPSTANVAVAPIVARFEIAKVEYDATAPSSVNNVITSYDLEGIFVNNHHKAMGMNFTPISGQLYSSTTASDYTVTNFPAPLSDKFTGKTGAIAYTAVNGVWAYQFFPVNPANILGDQPMLVVKISNISETASPVQFAADQYISVNKFEDVDNPGMFIEQFDANHIYKIVNFTFSNRNLSTSPGTVLQDVYVTVEITPWVDVNIIPEL